MRAAPSSVLLFVLCASSACTTYEYEEEVFLEPSGAGQIRVSGSKAILAALHHIDQATLESVRAHFASNAVEVISVRETRRGERSFLHVQMSFADWTRLCQSPPFRERHCRLEMKDDENVLELESPRPTSPLPEGVDPTEMLAVRFHLPSDVRFHNSPSGVERGNILSWARPLGEYFESEPFSVEARFGRRSILAATVRIVLLAIALVASLIVGGVYWMVRKGRRQLEADQLETG